MVMTSVYPDRRAELDAYEDDIIDIYNFFGSKFYDYHKLFSSKAAVLLREKRVKVRDGNDYLVNRLTVGKIVSG